MAKSRRSRTRTTVTHLVNDEENLSSSDACIWQLKKCWLSRSILFCNGAKLFSKDRHQDNLFFALINIDESDIEDSNPSILLSKIKQLSKNIASTKVDRTGALFTNLLQVNKQFGLTPVETEIILFATLLELDSSFGNCFDLYGSVTNRFFYSFLSHVLNTPLKEIGRALKKDSVLHKTGLLKIDSDACNIDRKFDLLSGICGALENDHENIDGLFSDYIVLAPSAKLSSAHYLHIQEDYNNLSKYIQAVCLKEKQGSNVLIYGPPGTGKTQWIRTLTEEINIKLYEISVEDSEGDILSGKDRVTACQLAQVLLNKGQNKCILFDEIEDLFQSESPYSLGRARFSPQSSKGWINQLLENNTVPTFWVSNDISTINDAFLRRFDLIFELPVPPHSVRKQVLTDALKDNSVSEPWIDRMSHLDSLPPAIIARAAQVNSIIGNSDPALVEKNIEGIIGNTLKAMGHKYQASPLASTDFYDPKLINSSFNLEKIASGLKNTNEGRLCLYGPPGTGKSAYSQYLSNYLNIPLISKRASDIVDCYVGNTEKNIARMFQQASDEKSILLLDEADSFLRDRREHNHGWETSQVNELLVQMESFSGIFICSTNLMHNLDSAALRRFDIKLEFSYLNTEQGLLMLQGSISSPWMKLSSTTQKMLIKKLAAITHLTPGDFSAVKRKLRVLDESDNVELFIQSLEEEISFKTIPHHRPIGFTAHI